MFQEYNGIAYELFEDNCRIMDSYLTRSVERILYGKY